MLSRRRLPPDLGLAELAAAAATAAAGWEPLRTEQEPAAEPRPSRAGDKPDTAAWDTKSCCELSPRKPLVALLAGLVPHVRLVAPLAVRLWDLSADRMAAAAVTDGPRLCCCFTCCWCCGEEGSTCRVVGFARGGGRGRRGIACQGGEGALLIKRVGSLELIDRSNEQRTCSGPAWHLQSSLKHPRPTLLLELP